MEDEIARQAGRVLALGRVGGQSLPFSGRGVDCSKGEGVGLKRASHDWEKHDWGATNLLGAELGVGGCR